MIPDGDVDSSRLFLRPREQLKLSELCSRQNNHSCKSPPLGETFCNTPVFGAVSLFDLDTARSGEQKKNQQEFFLRLPARAGSKEGEMLVRDEPLGEVHLVMAFMGVRGLLLISHVEGPLILGPFAKCTSLGKRRGTPRQG